MNTIDINKIMEAYDKRLDTKLQVDLASLKTSTIDKPQKSTRNIFRYRIIEVLVFSFLALSLGWYIASNWGQSHLVISGIILHLFTLIALIGSIGQLILLQQIDYAKPIIEIRKKIERVNSHGLLFVKLLLLSAPVWWSYAIVGLDVFLGYDIYIYFKPDFVQRYFVINLLLIIPLLWLFTKLSYKNLHVKWVRITINFFAGSRTMEALNSLVAIEDFEK